MPNVKGSAGGVDIPCWRRNVLLGELADLMILEDGPSLDGQLVFCCQRHRQRRISPLRIGNCCLKVSRKGKNRNAGVVRMNPFGDFVEIPIIGKSSINQNKISSRHAPEPERVRSNVSPWKYLPLSDSNARTKLDTRKDEHGQGSDLPIDSTAPICQYIRNCGLSRSSVRGLAQPRAWGTSYSLPGANRGQWGRSPGPKTLATAKGISK
jgi:hypothetical protein